MSHFFLLVCLLVYINLSASVVYSSIQVEKYFVEGKNGQNSDERFYYSLFCIFAGI